MICNVCGCTEVFIEEGVEYCKECNNQILGSRDEESANESFSKKALLSSPGTKKTTTKHNKILYAPWISIEAYNLILSKQISALISLGCSEKLKPVVLHIWAKYLQKIQIAFRKDAQGEENIPYLSPFALKRDIQLLYGDGISRVGPRKMSSKISKKKSFAIEKKKIKDSKANTLAVKKEKDDYSSDDTTESIENLAEIVVKQDNIDEVDNSSTMDDYSDTTEQNSSDTDGINATPKKKELKYSAYAKAIKKNYPDINKINSKVKDNCMHHMTLSKTLSFCQLGLLYTNDQVLLFDLIRLVGEGRIPYIGATNHFPSSMKLQADFSFDKNTAPDMKSVSTMSAKLFGFLNLPKFKHLPLLPIAIRFVKDLNLPNDLIPVVKVLINKFETKNGEWYNFKTIGRSHYGIPLYEVHAMSFIVIALKMLLVLDNQFEIEHDDVMKKLDAIEISSQFFIWSEWQQQMMLKEYLFLKNGFSHLDMNQIDSLCADRILSDYPCRSLKLDLYELAKNETKNQHEARVMLKNLIEPMFVQDMPKGKATSFSLKYQLHRLMTEWERLPLYKDTKEIDFSFLSKDFSKHKLYCQPSSCSSNSEDIIQLLLSTLYESDYKLTRNDELKPVLKTSRKYWYVNYQFKDLIPDVKEEWLESLPSNFKWLLKFLCKYLQINHLEFYTEIKHNEHRLFKQR